MQADCLLPENFRESSHRIPLRICRYRMGPPRQILPENYIKTSQPQQSFCGNEKCPCTNEFPSQVVFFQVQPNYFHNGFCQLQNDFPPNFESSGLQSLPMSESFSGICPFSACFVQTQCHDNGKNSMFIF